MRFRKENLHLLLRDKKPLREIQETEQDALDYVAMKGQMRHRLPGSLSRRKYYRAVDEYVAQTGRLYRGYHFDSETERTTFIQATNMDGIDPGGKRRTLSLSAFVTISGRVSSSGPFGVIFEIDKNKIKYRRVRQYLFEEPHYALTEAEFRTRHILPDAIVGTYLTSDTKDVFDSSQRSFVSLKC